jgi:hypothetical protein
MLNRSILLKPAFLSQSKHINPQIYRALLTRLCSLAKEHRDAELLEELYELFKSFGECWIIIRREMSDSAIPFAFVQYKVSSSINHFITTLLSFKDKKRG